MVGMVFMVYRDEFEQFFNYVAGRRIPPKGQKVSDIKRQKASASFPHPTRLFSEAPTIWDEILKILTVKRKRRPAKALRG